MKKLENRILNLMLDSMRLILGDYAIEVAKGVPQLVIGEDGKIVNTNVDSKEALQSFVSKYENILGNFATIKMANCLVPYIKANKKIKKYLPKSILDTINQKMEIDKNLAMGGKTKTRFWKRL